MINRLDDLLRQAERVSRFLAWLGGIMLLVVIALTAVEILLRRTFSIALGLGFELSGYVLAVAASWSFAYALFNKAHIRIDAVYVRFGQRTRVAPDLLALVAFVVFAVALADASLGVALESISRGSLSDTPLQTPMWIPQVMWSVGLLWFAFVTLLLLLRTVVALRQGDLATAQQLIGSPTLDERIEDEAPDLEKI